MSHLPSCALNQTLARPPVGGGRLGAVGTWAGLLVLLFVAPIRRTETPKASDIDQLRTGHAAKVRRIEGRLSGFAWLRYSPDARLEPSPTEMRLAGEILENGDESMASRQAQAVALILVDKPQEAVERLSTINEATLGPAQWSDLSVAYLATARQMDQPALLADALAAADTALDLSPSLPEARFNRALIIEALGLRDAARGAWQDYARTADMSPWAAEGQEHRRLLSAPTPEFASMYDLAVAALGAGNPDGLKAVATSFPHLLRARAYVELREWATSDVGSSDAARHLTVVRAIGREIAARGEHSVEDYVGTIDSADALSLRMLVAAQRLYDDGCGLLSDRLPTAAEPIFRRAAHLYERAGSVPMTLLASRQAAVALYEENRIPDARRVVDDLLPRIPRTMPTLAAEVFWQVALCHTARSEWGEAIAAFEKSLVLFGTATETYNVAIVRHILAEIYDTIGDPTRAWKLRVAALRELGRTSSVRTQTCLSAISREAAQHRRWRTAVSFLGLELALAEHLHDVPSHTDAYLRRATALHSIGREDAARRDLASARELIAQLDDVAVRTRAHADELAVAALLNAAPNEAVRNLTVAIDFHLKSGRRMYLPTLYLYRARALRAINDRASARRDVAKGIAELEASRETLPDAALRIGIFDASQELFSDAIEDALQRSETAEAFRYAERARARALLDVLPRVSHDVIGDDSALIEFASLSSRVVIFVVDVHGVHAVESTSAPTAIATEAQRFREALAAGDAEAARRSSRELYSSLIAPAEPLLTAATKLVFVPDHATAGVPFAALRDSAGRFIIETYSVATAPSAAIYQMRRRWLPSTRSSVLVIAPTGGGQVQLDDAARESVAISRLYATSVLLSGDHATAEELARHAGDADIIHFVGHGLAINAGGASTALVLGSNRTLEREAIERLRLPRTSVVILAACNTGRGELRWSEGTLSIARAFLVAGVPSVIATLWPIDDAAAAHFYPRLHEHLARGLAPADALRTTQLEWLRGADRDNTIWAAVQLIGG